MIWWAAAWAAPTDPDGWLRASRAAESEGRFAEAVEACRSLAEQFPSSPRRAPCDRRAGLLERRRDLDGTFSGWSALEQARRGSPDGESQVEGALDRGGMSEATALEATLWLARRRLATDPAGVAASTAPWLDRAVPEEDALLRQAREQHALALAALGRHEEALAVQASVAVASAASARRLTPVEEALRDQRRSTVAVVSGGIVIVYACVAAWFARGGLAPARLWGLVPLALAALGGAALGAAWDRPLIRDTVPALVAAIGALHVLSAFGLRGAKASPVAVGVLRSLAVAATLAAAWLVLWRARALDLFGL